MRTLRVRLGDAITATAAFLAVAAIGVVVVFGGTDYRDECRDNRTGVIAYGHWHLSPLAWFQSGRIESGAVCATETRTEAVVGAVPIIGPVLADAIGGPSASDFPY